MLLSTMQLRRKDAGSPVQFRVGQVMQHKRYGYRGVITGWDETCKVSACNASHVSIVFRAAWRIRGLAGPSNAGDRGVDK